MMHAYFPVCLPGHYEWGHISGWHYGLGLEGCSRPHAALRAIGVFLWRRSHRHGNVAICSTNACCRFPARCLSGSTSRADRCRSCTRSYRVSRSAECW